MIMYMQSNLALDRMLTLFMLLLLHAFSVDSLCVVFCAFVTRQCRQRYYVFGLIVRCVCPSVRSLDRSCCHNISWTAWAILMKLTEN